MRHLAKHPGGEQLSRCCCRKVPQKAARWHHRGHKRLVVLNNSISDSHAYNDSSNIKIVGIGGCASQAVNKMWDSGVQADLDLVLMNTDIQELAYNTLPDQNKLLLGAHTTQWEGTEGDASKGRAAALESAPEIADVLDGAKLVIVVAGMGGGTGRGAAPVVAEISKQLGAFTVGIAATPTALPARQASTQDVRQLAYAADALVMLPTHKLLAGASKPLSSSEVYAVSDRLMLAGIQGMADVVRGSSVSDISELRTAMAGGSSWIGHSTAMGPDRAASAAIGAINSPLRLSGISQVSSLLVLVTAPEDTTTRELNDIVEAIQSEFGSQADMTFRLKTIAAPFGALSVTVIATIPDPSRLTQQQSRIPAGYESD